MLIVMLILNPFNWEKKRDQIAPDCFGFWGLDIISAKYDLEMFLAWRFTGNQYLR